MRNPGQDKECCLWLRLPSGLWASGPISGTPCLSVARGQSLVIPHFQLDDPGKQGSAGLVVHQQLGSPKRGLGQGCEERGLLHLSCSVPWYIRDAE